MAHRVTAQEVKEIITTSQEDNIVTTFINAANVTVTNYLSSETSLSSEQLKEIERWLAAHFLACAKEPQAMMEAADDAKIQYQGKTDKGLQATLYGQQVLVLDTSGKLAKNLGKKRATIRAITSFD